MRSINLPLIFEEYGSARIKYMCYGYKNIDMDISKERKTKNVIKAVILPLKLYSPSIWSLLGIEKIQRR